MIDSPFSLLVVQHAFWIDLALEASVSGAPPRRRSRSPVACFGPGSMGGCARSQGPLFWRQSLPHMSIEAEEAYGVDWISSGPCDRARELQ